MSHTTIAILDPDTKRTEFFKNLFMRDDYDVRILDDLSALLDFEKGTHLIAILVDYDTLNTEDRQIVLTFFKRHASSNLFIYNLPNNANKRLAFYELGARRVFDQSQPLDEIYYALAWPLKNIRGDLDKDKVYSSGNLEEVSLKSLINTLGKEQRTGILRVEIENNNGKVYFKNGFVTHAKVGLKYGQKALLHMIFWHRGRFSFSASPALPTHNSVSLSPIAILILAEKIRKQYVKDIKVLGSKESMIRLRYLGDLIQSDIVLNAGFQNTLARPQNLGQVLENHYYCNFETASKLAELFQRGFLEVHRPYSAQKQATIDIPELFPTRDFAVSTFFDEDDTDAIIKKLNLLPGSKNGLFMLSTTGVASYNMLKAFSGHTPDASANSAIYHSKVILQKDIELDVYSLALNEFVLDDLSQYIDSLRGLVFLVDVSIDEQFEYEKYIIRQMLTSYNVPWMMAFSHGLESTNLSALRAFFDLSVQVETQQCIPDDYEDIKRLLLQMDKYPLKEYKIKTESQKANA